MRRRSVRSLLFGCLFLTSLLTSAQNKNQKQGCEDNCFSTEILSVEELASGCLSYTLQVNADGSCAHALSHYSVSLPACAQGSSVSNSEGWKIEYGTDPTSGIAGFKVDEISGFGENGSSGNFTVTFTLCENGCDEALSCWAPQVAYKAATCVFYEDTEVTCVKLDAGLNIVDATCSDEANGSIGVSIIEGTEPITYVWSNGSTNQTIENAPAGVYMVTITDATGETMELSGEVDAPSPINIGTSITDASCQGQSDGAVITTVEGGVAPYIYSWSTGATTENLEGISGGYYVLTVTDANGCEAKATAIVENTVFIDINGIITNSGCSTNNGSVDVTVEGGVAPYTFYWSNGQETEDLSGLAAGAYRLTATDANGCLSSRTFIVRENNPISLSASMQQTACVENNSGAIDLTIIGGEEPYSYSWSNGEATEDIDGLAAGRYTVNIVDNSGCSASLSVDVTAVSFQANSIVSQISCNGANDGEIELMTTGGTEPFTFEWSNGESTDKITGLSPGQYSVLITDAAGCTKNLAYYLPDATPISASYSVTNPNCLDDGFEVSVSVSGGKAPYTYDWSDGSSLQNLSAAAAGSYSLLITDINGCTNTIDVVVDYASTGCDDPDDGGDNPDDGGDNPDDGGDNPDDGGDNP
ncbi:SprB repeat-containing protein, partial [Fulvivirga lutimaris]|uniref:SprB repeat-containing protein n=1 Tax=Fulvivirga lutimaris TaxID=1819566 RepID=UPI001C871FFD